MHKEKATCRIQKLQVDRVGLSVDLSLEADPREGSELQWFILESEGEHGKRIGKRQQEEKVANKESIVRLLSTWSSGSEEQAHKTPLLY